MLALGFHNIFIIHGKGRGKHTDVGCTMVGLCGVEILSQFFFVHGMCEKYGICIPCKKSKIQRSNVLCLITSAW
jgi:hypothetical protein